jgi:microcystin-dependent protein
MAEIKMIGYNWAPRGWALCDGRLLPTSQYSALYSLLMTRFGGDGVNNFGLPDLRGRVPIAAGHGPGLSNRLIGQKGGTVTQQLSETELPSHAHNPIKCSTQTANQRSPAGAERTLGVESARVMVPFVDTATGAEIGVMHPQIMTDGGGGQAHENRQPYLAINFVICLDGIYPPRP